MAAHILTMDVETAPLDDISPYPGNARRGDLGAIKDSLETHGQYRPLVVQRSTGYVLCGNNTLAAAQELGWAEVAVQYLDVDDDQARKILLADNKTNDAATYDEVLLAHLLADLDDTTGTGYTDEEYDDLIAVLQENDPEPTPLHPTPPHAPTPHPPEGHPATTPSAPLEAGQRLDGNTTWVTSIEEKRANYETSQTRQLVLTYQGHTYIWVVNTLADLAATYGTTNNPDTITRALADLTNTTPPQETQ